MGWDGFIVVTDQANGRVLLDHLRSLSPYSCRKPNPNLLAKILPRCKHWLYELKFDRYRGIAIKDGSKVRLYSRNGKDLSRRFNKLTLALAELPCSSAIIDGEIVCFDRDGRPCFEDLQNYKPNSGAFLCFYAFDILHLDGRDTGGFMLAERKALLEKLVSGAADCIRLSDSLDADPEHLVTFAREHKLEGVVAKDRNSVYESGRRSGKWVKFKTYQEAEFLIGGFLPALDGFSSIAVGFRDGKQFRYAAKPEICINERCPGGNAPAHAEETRPSLPVRLRV